MFNPQLLKFKKNEFETKTLFSKNIYIQQIFLIANYKYGS